MADVNPSDAMRVQAPYPGSHEMPRWNVAELIDAPTFRLRNWTAMIGPGLVMGAAAIGGGEWLTGPMVTARYGGALLWLATLSILGQVVYNLEICRYTLYTGEPIFTGKFRTLPGPHFWVLVYLLLDFGSFFPYLAAFAATPLATAVIGEIPNAANGHGFTILGYYFDISHEWLMRGLSYAIFLGAMLPLLFGGKVLTALKWIMSFKLVTVMGFLLVLAFGYSTWDTWVEIFSGFLKFGNVPVLPPSESTAASGDNIENIFLSLASGRGFPQIDWSVVALLSAMVAIAGSGGLSNTPLSNYTRDQGWGMGSHVGAIPSIIGGSSIQLSHVGSVFLITRESLRRWRRWYRHVLRDQLIVWMPACFVGLALPSMLSAQFLERGTVVADKWVASTMTAEGVATAVGPRLGPYFWFMVLFCGFLVLAPSMATSVDGVVRRWVDVFWTSSRRLREVDPRNIRYVYFGVLAVYAIFGMTMLSMNEPQSLLTVATTIYNFALGFSAWHTLAVNLTLLPRELRPGWFVRIALFLAGLFFWVIATLSALTTFKFL
ncbi:MAG: Nramp family divalent metal transporter [Planctomycetaceae bacterium]|nr:Nramp family divalent metal transporter [Planctomycetaceae bacterium]